MLGGSWVPGRSWHPERGPGTFDVRDPAHPVTRGLADPDATFTADDERYSSLDVAPTAHVLVTHRHDGVDHPVVWTHDAHGGLTVYDALGHDARAYREPVRRRLLQREALWLLG
jgi:type 1 glutamine amidotransferase